MGALRNGVRPQWLWEEGKAEETRAGRNLQPCEEESVMGIGGPQCVDNRYRMVRPGAGRGGQG